MTLIIHTPTYHRKLTLSSAAVLLTVFLLPLPIPLTLLSLQQTALPLMGFVIATVESNWASSSCS